METLSARELYTRGGDIRRALKRGEQVAITYHDKPWAKVVPHDYGEDLETENARLRAELETYQRREAKLR